MNLIRITKNHFCRSTLALTGLLALNSTAGAYQKPPMMFVIPSPLKESEMIDKQRDLKMTKLEIDTKRDLIRMRLFKPRDFFELKNNKLENSALLQSYIDEVDEAFWGFNKKINPKQKIDLYGELMKGKPIDIAKKIAKQQMLTHIQRNWTALRETIFNESTADNWDKGGRTSTLKNLNSSFIYVPQAGQQYLFKFGDSFVEIDKRTLKKGYVGIDVNSRLDKNKIAPEAENIIADDAGEDKETRRKRLSKSKNSEDHSNSPSPDNFGGQNTFQAPTPAQAPQPASPHAYDGGFANGNNSYYPNYQNNYPGGLNNGMPEAPPPPPPAPYEPGFDLNNF